MKQKGNILITVLIFTVIGMTITGGIISIALNENTQIVQTNNAQKALSIAQSGGEKALIKLLRDPSYTGGSYNISNGTVTITINNTNNNIEITSMGTFNNNSRTIRITSILSENNNTITGWEEV
jgi:hypothetical protein